MRAEFAQEVQAMHDELVRPKRSRPRRWFPTHRFMPPLVPQRPHIDTHARPSLHSHLALVADLKPLAGFSWFCRCLLHGLHQGGG